MSDDIREHIKELLSRKLQEDKPLSADKIDEVKSKLATMARHLAEENQLNVGQFVTWKPGLKNKLKPRLNEPAIIVQMLDNPLYDQGKDSGSPYFMEPLDVVIGVLEEEHQTFMLFYVDKRRLMPYDSRP